ncbi:phage tail termination protein [Nocardia rhizosphaerae]|uniref:Tail terminator n=1 Tax=Nocardia rhizosphaerae TaxID=1691571 RepID=A0ABV8LF24_9NOCA
MTMPPFPSFDDIMKALLDDIAPVVTFESDQLEPPYIFVTRVGGRASDLIDAPVIDIEYVASTREESKVLKSAGQERVLAAGNTAPGGYLIDTADEQTGGRFMPPLRRDDRGVTATVRLTYRRPRG